MKIRKSNGFVPIELTISIETEEEARALYAIFNHTRNVGVLPLGMSDKIRSTIGREFGTSSGDTIANGVSYDGFFGATS